jgi:redox-sensitive bicupin YhaK (pirin superfamily)
MLPPGAGFDVGPHPHIGLSTLTYGLAGDNVHRDSLGSEQINRPGDVNLLTAGRGVVHSERATPEFRASGGLLHGVQIWLALPPEREDDEPSFTHHPQATLPAIAPGAGARGRVLMGSGFGARSPIEHPSHPWLVDLEFDHGATIDLEPGVTERAVFVIEGALRIGDTTLVADTLALLEDGVATLSAEAPTRVLALGGEPIGPRFMEWNFVSSSREAIARAAAAWRAGRFPRIPTDDGALVPMPEL